jgi:hypothetical protein
MTVLGTEDLNGLQGMPPGRHTFEGRCEVRGPAAVTLVSLVPHMHRYATGMTVELARADASSPVRVLDRPYDMLEHALYRVGELAPLQHGDALRTRCHYDNDSGQNVIFGESLATEQCYLHAYAYPAGALDAGALSLLGAINSCW